MVVSGNSFTKENWLAWGKELKAKPIPGSLAFFKNAYQQGITIFYVSNRYHIQKPETIANLKKLDFRVLMKITFYYEKKLASKKPDENKSKKNTK